MKTRPAHSKPIDDDVAIVQRFFLEARLAIETVHYLDEQSKGALGVTTALYEQLYNFHIAQLATIARLLLGNHHPFKRWSMNREALQWALAARKLRESLPTLGEKASPSADKVLGEIGNYLMVSVEEMRTVVYAPDPAGAENMKPSNPDLNVQFLLRAGYGPHRAALRALSKLTGVSESTVSDRLAQVFFFKPGEEGDPSR